MDYAHPHRLRQVQITVLEQGEKIMMKRIAVMVMLVVALAVMVRIVPLRLDRENSAQNEPLPEPTKLLGIPYDIFRKLYPNECSVLKRLRKDEKDFVTGNGQLVDTCHVKQHAKELVPGAKVKYEMLGWFSSPPNTTVPWCKLFSVYVVVEGHLSNMEQVYGKPDPAIQMASRDPMFGSVTYGGLGQSTTLNNEMESHTFITSWTRHFPNGWGLSIVSTTNVRETWGMMVRDAELGVDARPVVEEGVSFTMLPPLAK
jgi:hypothetical protein